MKKLTLLTILTLSLGLAITGCGDSRDDTTGENGTAQTGTDAGATDTAAAGTSLAGEDDAAPDEGGEPAAACELMEADHSLTLGAECDAEGCPCGEVISTVSGVIQDASGAPVVGAKAQICTRSARDGSSVCLTPVDANDDGSFTVTVPSDNNCLYEGVLRALAPGLSYSTAYCTYAIADLTVNGGVIDLSPTPAVLHATTAATDLPNECFGQACMESVDEFVTVNFEDGLALDVNPSWLFNGAVGLKDLSATYIDGTSHLCNGEQIEGAPGVWAFSPEGDGFEIRFPARIPDKLGLADGTAVNVYIQGGIGHTIQVGDEKTECEEGAWTHFACATVQDGVITLDETNGVPAIGWLTYAPAE
ncbi:MAG: carboxypeptidase-like regulatory domain-containing protein [Myxococcota bacterium]